MIRMHSVGIALVLAVLSVARIGAVQVKPAPASTPAARPAATVTPPPPVAAAFKRAYPNATIKNVSKERVSGKVEYEIESMDGTQARDLVYWADGTVVYYEELIPASAVPAAVVSAIKARYPKATLSVCEKLFKGGTMNYELILKGAAVEEVVLTPDGKWVSAAK